jgi:CDGSH-type Zn-finger protein
LDDDLTLKSGKKEKIKVTKNGPFKVTGSIPLSKMIIETDEENYPYKWKEAKIYPERNNYALCRCGKSKKKPYCDNTHTKIQFNGTETAGYACYQDNVKEYLGPELKLTDNRELCVSAGFCTRAGNTWNLTVHSDNIEYKKIAIEQAANCPSGRLVVWDKQDNPIEPNYKQSIVVTEDEDGVPGPLWVRGEIEIESADNIVYEKRNRVTLCRCDKTQNTPLCDGSHLDT